MDALPFQPITPEAGDRVDPEVRRAGELSLLATSFNTWERWPCTFHGQQYRSNPFGGDMNETALKMWALESCPYYSSVTWSHGWWKDTLRVPTNACVRWESCFCLPPAAALRRAGFTPCMGNTTKPIPNGRNVGKLSLTLWALKGCLHYSPIM